LRSLIEQKKAPDNEVSGEHKGFTAADFEGLVHHAFQLSTQLGPLCNEPVQGIAVFVETFDIEIPETEIESVRLKMGKITGEIMAAVQYAIKQGFLDWSPRLMLAMYSCDIQASSKILSDTFLQTYTNAVIVEVLGKVYGVITQRRGRIVGEEMKEGTPFFHISALLPAVESFGFGDDIRKKTSGAASPQLIFSGYEILDIDPFWEPFTEDELEDLGELADKENIAKKYMEDVRKRKGLFVAKRLFAGAEKQRTLKR
jgi:ribosome assembly protein 1